MSRFVGYLIPSSSTPPRLLNASPVAAASPLPQTSSLYTGMATSTPRRSSSLAMAALATSSSGLNRNTLSSCASDGALEDGLITSIPFSFTYSITLCSSALDCGPTMNLIPSECSDLTMSRAVAGSVLVSSTASSICQPASWSSRCSLKSDTASRTASS